GLERCRYRVMHRASMLALASALFAVTSCGSSLVCTEIGCDSTLVVDYGNVVVNEPYSLTINPGGQTVSVVCLSDSPADEPLTVEEALRPNGEDCEPVCYRRVGSVPPNGGLP